MVAERLRVIIAFPATVLFVTEVAVRVIVIGVVAVAGDVYVTGDPEELEAGDTLPHDAPGQPVPDKVSRVTPWIL